MLLGDADVEAALRECLLEQIEAGAGRHRGGDGDDLVVLLRFLDQALAEHLGVLRRAAFGFHLRAGGDVELDDAVIFVGGDFRRRVAFALLRHDMDQHRAAFGIAHVAQHRQQMVDDCGRRSGRHNRSRAPRTACRRSRSRARILRRARLSARRISADAGRAACRCRAACDRSCRRSAAPDRPTWRRPAGRSTCRCRSG